jgi:L-amino acid N-acyltransferase YncA
MPRWTQQSTTTWRGPGRGLGAELLTQLSGRARQEGLRRFIAVASAGNTAAAGLLRTVGAELVRCGHGTAEYEITLTPVAVGTR